MAGRAKTVAEVVGEKKAEKFSAAVGDLAKAADAFGGITGASKAADVKKMLVEAVKAINRIAKLLEG